MSRGGDPPSSQFLFMGQGGRLADSRKVSSSAQNAFDRAMFADREHDDRHTVFLGKRERGRVHDLQAAIHGFLMVEAGKRFGLGIVFWIRSMYPIDIGSLEKAG